MTLKDDTHLIPDLYRKEYGRIVAVLCSRYGLAFVDNAMDIVSDAFLMAAETWGIKGIPDNPAGWLYTVARNRAINDLEHTRVFNQKIRKDLSRANTENPDIEIDLSPGHITDSQLQMMFAICQPLIPVESQVSLALRILCGFTIDEIAQALLSSKENINKRLFRAKKKLRELAAPVAFPESPAIEARLDTVLLTLYLLFNEGYYSASPDKVLRKDFCGEAMRLTGLLTTHPQTGTPRVKALMALMCFQASRFEARVSAVGDLVLYEDQDSRLWDKDLINQGNIYFVEATAQEALSRYHLEAAIAWWHTHQTGTREKWENILRLYNLLLILEYSPMAALNRTYAFAKVYGKQKALVEAEGLELEGNFFYHSLLGDLYEGVDNAKAMEHLEKALEQVGSLPERSLILGRLSKLAPPPNSCS